jgi:hypothetical protein
MKRRRFLFLAAMIVTVLVIFSVRRIPSLDSTTAQSPKPKVNRPVSAISKDQAFRKKMSPPAASSAVVTSPRLEQNPAALVAFKKWAEIYAVTPPQNRQELSLRD